MTVLGPNLNKREQNQDFYVTIKSEMAYCAPEDPLWRQNPFATGKPNRPIKQSFTVYRLWSKTACTFLS